MSKNNNKFFIELCSKIGYDRTGEILNSLVNLYDSLSASAKSEIDLSRIEKTILYNIECGRINYEGIDDYCNRVNPSFRKKVNSTIENKCNDTSILCSYLEHSELDESQYINLSVKAIICVLPDNQKQTAALAQLKKQIQEKGLYDTVITEIKALGDVETMVCTALCFENKLIDEVFGGKESMFLYLSANTFTDDELIPVYLESLLSVDDNALEKDLVQKAKRIDLIIKNNKKQ